jgi:hypothetical protein
MTIVYSAYRVTHSPHAFVWALIKRENAMQRGFLGGLLGAAAGLAFVPAAQAADLPVKAKPVEYVKVCSAYGAGFYYIPGTDICLRVGGYVYAEYSVKGNDLTPNIYSEGAERIDADYNYTGMRTSARAILDARQNTAYGTLRAYLVVGITKSNSSSNAGGLDAAFIQFAGFTWGFTDSFFSFAKAGYGVAANPGTDWMWTTVLAYTAELGSGVRASVSIEEPTGRRTGVLEAVASTPAYGGRWAPDIVGNINVEQAWGRAQVMGALHQIKLNSAGLDVGADHEWGFAVGAGIEIKTPQTGAPNNSVILQGAYTKGATSYTGLDGGAGGGTGVTVALQNWAGTGPVYALHDAFVTAGNTHLVEAWSVYGAYRHYWTPMLRTSFGVGYGEIDGSNVVSAANPGNLELLQAGISTVWSPVANLDLSLDIVYSDITQKNIGGVAGTKGSNDLLSALARLRRNF